MKTTKRLNDGLLEGPVALRNGTIGALLTGLAALSLLATAVTCGDEQSSPSQSGELRDLEPYPNRFVEDPLYEPQPHRDNPRALALSTDGARLFVALQGSVDEPGNEVLAVDVASRTVVDRYTVGRSPTGLAVHPDGRFLVVTNRFSNYLSVVDLQRGRVTHQPADFYLMRAAFSPDGGRLYLTNRWRDSLQVWDVGVEGGRFEVVSDNATAYPHGIPVGTNPRDLLVSADGSRVYVAGFTGMTLSVVDTVALEEIDVDADPDTTDFGAPDGVTRLHLGSPPNGLEIVGDYLYLATTSASTHHPALEGPDTNRDETPGDGTPNQGFRDLQNEIAVLAVEGLQPLVRYTSDTICCFDFLDVPVDDPDLGALLPDQSLWIVEGALPEQLAAYDDDGTPALAVIYAGSSQAQRFTVETDGTLAPGPIIETGTNPADIVVNRVTGQAYISNRLGESLTVVDLERFEVVDTVVVGDVQGGEFPATDAEIGELYYFAGAEFGVDGDQTCDHCHRDRGNLAKTFSMPLLADSRGSRMTPASRGMFETRPWFFEGAMDENNFFPVINEFVRPENFCCWDFPDLEDCPTNPPAECAERSFPFTLPTRDEFFVETADRVLGRDQSYGGALDTRIDYLGMTRLLGLFIMHEPALLPNPNPADTPDVARGRQIFNSPATSCVVCHPSPGFAVSFENNPFDATLHFGPLISPDRDAEGTNLDRAHGGFLQTFPMARQDDQDIRLNALPLAGIWDRAPMFLHDGRARNLREALSTPGHEALLEGETGFNECDGVIDSHGGTSQLTPGDVQDLITFIMTL